MELAYHALWSPPRPENKDREGSAEFQSVTAAVASICRQPIYKCLMGAMRCVLQSTLTCFPFDLCRHLLSSEATSAYSQNESTEGSFGLLSATVLSLARSCGSPQFIRFQGAISSLNHELGC